MLVVADVEDALQVTAVEIFSLETRKLALRFRITRSPCTIYLAILSYDGFAVLVQELTPFPFVRYS
jgi:hypothetical protein